MPILSKVDLWIPASVSPDPSMGAKWENVLKTLATLINDRRKAKIPDEAAFQNKVAELANQAWAEVINPAYLSKRGRTYADIKNTHDINMQGAFSHWSGKLDEAFATVDGIEAKRFKDQVAASKRFWTEVVGAKMLRLTGDKIRGRGAATIATYWLIGDDKAAGMLRPQDTGVVGGPLRVCKTELIQSFQAALMQRLIQAGVLIFSSKYDAAVITKENDTINSLITGMIAPELGLEPFSTGGASHLEYVKQGALLKLSIQVSAI